MRPRRGPVPRAESPWGWLGGILTLGILLAGAVAAGMALWENIDLRRLTRAPGDVELPTLPMPVQPPAAAAPDSTVEMFIYASNSSADYFPNRDFYPELLGRWEELAIQAGGLPRFVRSAEEIGALGGRGLVIAPAAICLADTETAALRQHADDGGGLLLTWATGARDDSCEWRGWDVVQAMTNAADVRQLEQREGLFMSVPAGLPVSAGIEPAARIELRWDAPIAVSGEGSRVYWSDWALNPEPATGTDVVDGAITLRSLDQGGRIAWYGFMDDAGVTPLDQTRIHRLITDGIRWAAGIPTASLLAWPDARQAALMFAQEVSGEVQNAAAIERVAGEQDVAPTWFVVSRLIDGDASLSSAVGRSGEVASLTSDNSPLAGLLEGEQTVRLRRSVSEVQEAIGRAPTGLRAPEEMADFATLEAWYGLGGRYVVGLNEGRTGSPEIIAVDGGEIVLLPRVIKDDYNLLVQERVVGQRALTDGLTEGTWKMRALGGLAVLTAHSRLAGSPRYVGQLAAVLEDARTQGNWWIATGAQIADWTLTRQTSQVLVTDWSEDAITIQVRAPENHPLGGGWVEVAMPPGTEDWAPRPVDRTIAYGSTPWGIVIPVPDLEAGGATAFTIGPSAPVTP